MYNRLYTLGIAAAAGLLIQGHALAANCVYINAYHPGYAWSDRIQQQFQAKAYPLCHTKVYYLDAKHNNDEQLHAKGKEIASLIQLAKPDIVIAADDAASAYVVAPFLRNTSIPVVYVGINWDPRPYGYPMDNATGMTEIWPVQHVLTLLKKITNGLRKITIVSALNPLEQTDANHIQTIANKQHIQSDVHLVKTFAQWKQAILNSQESDAIYLGTDQGIKDWDKESAIQWLIQHNKRFTFAAYDFMSPYAMLTYSKQPEEFGSWAARLAEAILVDHYQPWQIPIVPNHHFTSLYNASLLSSANYQLPAYIQRASLAYPANP